MIEQKYMTAAEADLHMIESVLPVSRRLAYHHDDQTCRAARALNGGSNCIHVMLPALNYRVTNASQCHGSHQQNSHGLR